MTADITVRCLSNVFLDLILFTNFQVYIVCQYREIFAREEYNVFFFFVFYIRSRYYTPMRLYMICLL